MDLDAGHSDDGAHFSGSKLSADMSSMPIFGVRHRANPLYLF